ncbi:hypothetical protein ACB092_05G151500 [Castanea dentata]
MFFLYGHGGTGKTFVYGGCTAHSRFRILLCVNEDSVCDIKQKTQLAKLLCATILIIWDKAPMAHCNCFEALDRTLRDILRFSSNFDPNKVFGGITLIFGGDFRQILLVIPKGRREDIVASAINKSVIWNHCEIFMLTENMRLNQNFNNLEDSQSVVDFGNWILRIENDLDMHDKMKDSQYLQERAILAPTNEIVNKINDQILSLVDEEELVYQLADWVIEAKIITGTNIGSKVFILRIILPPTASKWLFILKRRQFPISVSFAMIINKSQGQSLNRVSLFLPQPIFTHGQLYVVISRVTNRNGLKI